MPAVVLWDRYKFRPCAGAIHAHALCVGAKVTPSREAIATMSTRDVSLPYHEIALCESFHMIAYIVDNADELMADRHGNRDRFLRPRVPVVNVNISSADRGFQDSNKHVIATHFRDGHFLDPQPRLGFRLHDGLHRFLHDRRLGESGTHETKFIGRQRVRQRMRQLFSDCMGS